MKEVLIYKFFLGVPKLLVVLINDCVLVWVAVSGGGADRGGEELGKKGSGNRVRRWFDGKRWERSGWLWGRGTRGQGVVDGGKEDGLGEGLDSDVIKGDVVAEVMIKMGMGKGVLSGGNQWAVLLLLKLGNGLIDKAEETFGSGEVRGQGADVVGRGLWDDGGVGQWVDQQDAR